MLIFRSGSENYELNGPDERLSSSDHSDKYSHIYMYGNENGDIMSGKNRLQGGMFIILCTFVNIESYILSVKNRYRMIL